MSREKELYDRSQSACELCSATVGLKVYEVPPARDKSPDSCALICTVCLEQVEKPELVDVHHWRCLNDSMWSQVPAVQVLAWRMLMRLRSEGWPQDLLEMLYLDDSVQSWAEAIAEEKNIDDRGVEHLDSNGTVLESGDTVTLIKDLNVKGANFTAKRGTTVRNISLVAENGDQIEGRVSGQRIVILTKFVKKS